ncbi:hypothetical protein HPP92_015145 [Vanilla planifolia]|uniref:Aldehyde oxidase/xanthine dehydrogenase second molybdopterin binding domain-containing protein n=1 Tax=Vanilla planifolia TaxID=51239 RepID=A0A835QMT3_VANPL|nr:hypothetical protein HPP92_015652 [Vanilla planifolia]KAG0475459.1 hypothetical protein HPP92_015145 [Vanilla planifolia]
MDHWGTTSESSCEAVRLACNVLIDRLKPLKEMLQEQTGSVSWNDLILQARLQSVNLSASTYWVPDQGSMQYLNYGAAVSEVEVDVLTGRTTILRTDLIYDCGQSLNPAVDLGQIEGAFVQGIGFSLDIINSAFFPQKKIKALKISLTSNMLVDALDISRIIQGTAIVISSIGALCNKGSDQGGEQIGVHSSAWKNAHTSSNSMCLQPYRW